uniref:Acidic ribosomal P0 protein n=1 Tax=Euplotes raikovi TaxID=5938 RepID=Q52H31_EUPRA|nr:acidic ribosomal P0 protein [Euplotes raikovi]
MAGQKNEKREKKDKFFQRIYDTFDKYSRALLVQCDNISARQIHATRKELRQNDSLMLMGKNTVIKAALAKRIAKPDPEDSDYETRSKTWTPLDKMEPLGKLLKGNLGIIFTNRDLPDVKDIVDKHAREAPAKVGAVAQCDVFIKPGPTGLDPKQTGFFQNLQIPTKIVKTQIEIVSEKQIIWESEKVGSNEAALLQKLGINPFSYKLKVVHVFDNGNVYGPGVLDITPESIIESYKKVLHHVAAISMEANYPTLASAPHTILRSFKNLIAVTYETDYTFEQAEAAKNRAAAAPVAASGPAAEEAPVEEEPQEEPAEDIGAGDLFGGDDDDY